MMNKYLGHAKNSPCTSESRRGSGIVTTPNSKNYPLNSVGSRYFLGHKRGKVDTTYPLPAWDACSKYRFIELAILKAKQVACRDRLLSYTIYTQQRVIDIHASEPRPPTPQPAITRHETGT